MSSQPHPATAFAFRYRFIDALRGLAALAVVGFHAKAGHHIDALCDAMPPFVSTLLGRGDLGVEVFFVVSGFVLAHSMAETDVDLRYVGRFLLRRSVRLDPPYWASMVLVVALGLLSNRFVPGKAFAPPGPGRVLAHVLYLQDLLGVPPLNSIYWTLCIEVQFYLAFALMMLLATALRRRGLSADRAFYAVILPAALVADLWPLGLAPFEVRGLFVGRFHLFVAGVVVWWAAVPRRGDRLATTLAVGSPAPVPRRHLVQPVSRAQPRHRRALPRGLPPDRRHGRARGDVAGARARARHRARLRLPPCFRASEPRAQPEDHPQVSTTLRQSRRRAVRAQRSSRRAIEGTL
jgi:peptidoglycan/LPS O-acetylase OafA/YrhL